MSSLFLQSVQHLQPLYFKEIANSATYLFLKSYFVNAWCSFLVPKVEADELDWDRAESIVEKERENGYVVSYYVHESLDNKYRVELRNRNYNLLGNDAYLFKSLAGVKLATAEYRLVEVDNNNLKDFTDLSVSCFPDWENNREYCQRLFDLSIQNDEVILEKNYLVEKQGEQLGMGAMLMNRRLHLAYLHNLGTVQKYRRQGVFSWLVRTMEMLALGAGIDHVYSIAEADSASYKGLAKLGYDEVERYYVYARSDR